MNKKHQLIILPTNKNQSIISKRISDGKLLLAEDHLITHFDEDVNHILQNIYIVSDEEVKNDDWYMVELYQNGIIKGFYVEKCKTVNSIWVNNFSPRTTRHINNCKKIVVSTDQSLNLPQLPDSFIQQFIEEYNKGNVITVVEVEEYCEKLTCDEIISCKHICQNIKQRLKIHPQSIAPKKVKDSWARDEVVFLIKKALAEAKTTYSTLDKIGEEQWIKENV